MKRKEVWSMLGLMFWVAALNPPLGAQEKLQTDPVTKISQPAMDASVAVMEASETRPAPSEPSAQAGGHVDFGLNREPRPLESGDLTSYPLQSGDVSPEPIVDLLPEVQQAIDDIRAQSRGNVLLVECNGAFGYSTIQSAIDAAADGDTVVVLPRNFVGIDCTGDAYVENVDFLGKAITVQSAVPADDDIVAHTIIDGNQSGSVVTFRNAEGTDSVLDGLTLIHGSGTVHPVYPFQGRIGGGVFIWEASPTISRCVIQNNVSQAAAAIYSRSGSPLITTCLIRENENTSRNVIGGVVALSQVSGGHPRFFDNVISQNISKTPTMLLVGGYSAEIRNCTITDNQSQGFSIGELGFVVILGCGESTIADSVVWGNQNLYDPTPDWTPQISINVSTMGCSTLMVHHSDIEGGQEGIYVQCGTLSWGGGNINADPLFAAVGYHLQRHSPCVNAGDPAYVPSPGETDIDGEPRVHDGRVDMGADEWQPMLIPPDELDPAPMYAGSIELPPGHALPLP